MNTKKILGTLLAAVLGGLVAVFAYSLIVDNSPQTAENAQPTPASVRFANLPSTFSSDQFDFTYAAENTVHTVVNVKTESERSSYRNPLYEFFYGDQAPQQQPVVGIGSGVIISPDGYIVTNNHVIEGSNTISVTLNDNRQFDAKLVGTDPSTDIALLKIDSDKPFPYITWGNSDDLKLGQWVLAVGNPFNLTSTVTAGIVSAKGRNLGILKGKYRIESFIQTDAALNPGNSGGALVNTDGQLVGINSAIISPSGGYAGNSFAIPVSIVKKVVDDLKEYGEVQRAFLGVTIQDVTADLAKKQNLDILEGAYVSGLADGGAAEKAGVKSGDVITAINGDKVGSSAELQEQISKYRPGDKVTVTVNRDNKKKQFEVELRNMQGTTGVVKTDVTTAALGATFEKVSKSEMNRLGIDHGVKITKVGPGKLREAGIKENFIITTINNKPVNSADDINSMLEGFSGGVYIEGVYPNGVIAYYAFGM